MTPEQLVDILTMQIKELKSDLGKVSYEVSTKSIENTISFKEEQIISFKQLIKKREQS